MTEHHSASPWTLRDKCCIVTGATNGIGKQTARELAAQGARVVVVARHCGKGESTVRELEAEAPGSSTELLLCDFASQQSIRTAARDALSRFPVIHLLVNNAAVMNTTRQITDDGLEAMFGVNHIGYFLLTTLLLERIVASAPARIVNVASDAHRFAEVDFDDLQSEKRYGGMRTYGQSKGCNILFNLALSKRLVGTGVTTNALHPGAIRTGLGANNGPLLRAAHKVVTLFLKSPREGADTVVYLSSSPEVEAVTGEYFYKRKVHESAAQTRDAELAERLWTLSEGFVAGSASGAA